MMVRKFTNRPALYENNDEWEKLNETPGPQPPPERDSNEEPLAPFLPSGMSQDTSGGDIVRQSVREEAEAPLLAKGYTQDEIDRSRAAAPPENYQPPAVRLKNMRESKMDFENGIFEKLGGNPYKINVADEVEKANQELPDLFRHIFRGKVSWNDRNKLDKKQRGYWDDTVKRFRATAEVKAQSKKDIEIQAYEQAVSKYDSQIKQLEAMQSRMDETQRDKVAIYKTENGRVISSEVNRDQLDEAQTAGWSVGSSTVGKAAGKVWIYKDKGDGTGVKMQVDPTEAKKLVETDVKGKKTTGSWEYGQPTGSGDAPDETEFSKKTATVQSKILSAEQADITSIANNLSKVHDLRDIVGTGDMFTGAFAQQKLALSKMAKAIGISSAFDADINNTEQFASAIASEVANIIKAFGAGTGLSDADREFATKAAAGDITLDQASIMRLLNMNIESYLNRIETHNNRSDEVTKGYKMKFNPYTVKTQYKSKRRDAKEWLTANNLEVTEENIQKMLNKLPK